MKKITIIFTFIFIEVFLLANSEESKWKPTNINLGYFSELVTNPGLTVGTEYSLFRSKSNKNEISSDINLGFYNHERNSRAIFIDTNIGYRYTSSVGLTFQAQAGIGYIHSYLGAIEYDVIDGNLIEKPDYGTPGLMPSLSLGIGWDFRKKNIAPLNTYFKCKVFGRYPYIGMLLPQVGFSIGGIYYF